MRRMERLCDAGSRFEGDGGPDFRFLNDRAVGERIARGPDLIKSTFSLDEIVSQHADLYDRLLREQRLRKASPGERAIRSGQSSKPGQPAEIARRQLSEPQDVI